MRNKKILIILFLFFLLIISSFIILNKLKDNTDSTYNSNIINTAVIQSNTFNETQFNNLINNTNIYNNKNNKISEPKEIVLEDAIKEQNLSGDKELYELIETDYGKDVAVVKNDLQFSTIWAGIQKKSKPNINEIEDYITQMPTKNGIWIKEDSRDDFLTILENTIEKNVFYIDDKGYLQINEFFNAKDENGYISRIKDCIDSENKIMVVFRCSHYFIDTATGEIYEEEFEKLSPETPLIFYRENNSAIILLSTNKGNKITNEAYLESFLNCFE